MFAGVVPDGFVWPWSGAKASATERPADTSVESGGRDAPEELVERAASSRCFSSLYTKYCINFANKCDVNGTDFYSRYFL